MRNIIFLLTKDAMPCESLPIYGNKYWVTPNINELATNGTVFRKHYTAGGSTAMAMSAMLTGHYPYEFPSRKFYVNVKPSEFPSVFDTLQENGFECHVIWDQQWMDSAWRFTREFGDEKKTIIHNLDIAQNTGGHPKDQSILRSDSLLERTYDQIYETLSNIDLSKKLFIWMHLPHILKGRSSYMDDMDAFDNIVGFVRNLVGDDSLFISSDHGHMNMHKGKVAYGHDLYEPIVHIPLITPRIDSLSEITHLTSNIDLPMLLTEHKIVKREYVISETMYYAQPRRKVAIITERFKYIYNKLGKTEELYDLVWDPNEDYNILRYSYYDRDRLTRFICNEYYFYPHRSEALGELNRLREIKDNMWRNAPLLSVWYGVAKRIMSILIMRIKKRLLK